MTKVCELRFNKIDDYGNVRHIEDRKENRCYKLVPVQGDNGKWGYKESSGSGVYEEWRFKPEYDKAWPLDPDSLVAQVKVDEEKSYIDCCCNEIPGEELELDEYPADHDGVTYRGFNFIKTTKRADAYLRPDNVSGRRVKDFYDIFKKGEFDYDDVSGILAKAKSKFTHGHIPNWEKTMNEIIAETEVWLITEDDAKKRVSIKVNNRFTGEEEDLPIPEYLGSSPVNEEDPMLRQLVKRKKQLLDDLKKQPDEQQKRADLQRIEDDLRTRFKQLWENVETPTDWLGCYIPQTGTILIKVDSVDEAADLFGCSRDLLFEKVLLHEFIHAALDLCPRDAAGNISYHKEKWKWEDAGGKSFNEESIDNAIVLKLYKGTPGYRDVKGFIETQPYYYRKAVELYESDNLLPQLIEELIAYKISAPVSTPPSTATSGEYTYYVNGHIVASGKRAGIGAAAYEVFSRIIPTLSLANVLKKYGSLKLVGLPLVIDVNAYNKSPNQKRYYKVPINTEDGKDIYLCSQWYDNPANRDRHYDLLQDIVRVYPGLFPGGINRK